MPSLSPQKGEQKSPKKGRENYEFSRQELAPRKVLFIVLVNKKREHTPHSRSLLGGK